MSVSAEMPRYKSHKTVWALKIASIVHHANPDPTGNSVAASYGSTIYPAEPGYGPFDVPAEYVVKHQPQVGGYFVQYEDGYKSYSPAKAFEEGYAAESVGQSKPLEEAIVAAGADKAPRITKEHIAACIASEHYFTAAQGDAKAMEDAAFVNGALNGAAMRAVPQPLSLLTFCVLVLRNGFTVTGESACASPENFNTEIGRRIARENAVEKIWLLEGYLLREQLFQRTQPAQVPEA